MANTLGTVNGALIVQEALKTALTELPILTQVAHDFAPNAARYNQTVNFSVVTEPSVSSYSTTNGYATTNNTQTDKSVTINTHSYANITVNDQERSQSEVNLVERFSPVIMHSLFKAPVTALLALCNSTNFTNTATTESTSADIDRDTLIDAQVKLDGRDCPTMNRFCVLSPTAYGELLKDTSVVSLDYRTDKAAQSGRFNVPIQGFDIQMYSALSNSEYTQGFCGWRDCLLLATRVPELPSPGTYAGQVYNVTEPNTGLTAQVRHYYDMTLGFERLVITMMYGVAVGNITFGHRIVTSS